MFRDVRYKRARNEMEQIMLWNFDKPLSDEDVIAVFKAAEQGTWFSRRGVAKELRRAKSPTLVAKLTGLAERMVLVTQLVPLPNHVDMYVYRLNEDFEEGMST